MKEGYIKDPILISYMRRDARAISSEIERYCEDNIYQYRVMTTLWLAYAEDVDARNVPTFVNGLFPRLGIIGTIRTCASLADQFIANECSMQSMWSSGDEIVAKDDRNCDIRFNSAQTIFACTHSNDASVILGVLRFAKRFSPFHADLLAEKCMGDFFNLQNVAKMRNRRDWSSHVIRGVAEECALILKGYRPLRSDPHRVLEDGDFSPGNATNAIGDKSLSNKLASFCEVNLTDVSYPMTEADRSRPIALVSKYLMSGSVTRTPADTQQWEWPHISYHSEADFIYKKSAIANPVPKNYKQARIIAKEDSTRNYALTAVRKEMRRCIEKNSPKGHPYIKLDDQSPNQIAAFSGSMDGDYCTIDLSNASDSICTCCAQAILPPDVYRDIDTMRAQYVLESKGGCWYQASRNHIWLTSGCTVTFLSMSAILIAVGNYCKRLTKLFSDGGKRMHIKDIIVYGDDVCIDVAIYDMYIDILSLLGFTVNKEKSFGPDTRYRESCGVEYLDGSELTTHYWPRKPMSNPIANDSRSSQTYEALVDLQHKFYDYPSMNMILCREIDYVWSRCIVDGRSAKSSLHPNRPTYVAGASTLAAPWSDLPTPEVVPDWSYDRSDYSSDAHPRVNVYCVVGAVAGKVPDDLHSNPRYANYLMWKYVEYLLYGPKLSDDPVLRGLGITESRVRPGDFGGGSPAIVRVKDI